IAMIRSLVLSPARAAGLAGVRLAINAPDGRLSPRLSAISGVTAWIFAPSQGLLTTEPPLLAEATTTLTMLAGIAKPMPCDPPEREKIAVLIPTRRPPRSTRAPPELPGLMAASVWMKHW